MEPSSRKRLGCWFSALLERRTHHHGVVPRGFSRNAQSALDNALDEAVVVVAPGTKRGKLTREGLSLADLLPGECGYISRLAGEAQGRLRLLEMGMTPGTHVQVTRAAAFGGPLDVNVRGYQLSLRRDEAALVWLGDAPTNIEEADEEEEPEAPVYAVTVQTLPKTKREVIG